MKTKIILVAAGILLIASVSGFSQPETIEPGAPIAGTPGVATRQAVVNFTELAGRERTARANAALERAGRLAPQPGRAPQYQAPTQRIPNMGNPKEGPSNAPERQGFISPGAVPPATSPEPADSFAAFAYDGPITTPPDTQGAVGPSHLMVTLNQVVMIQDRRGQVLSTVTPSNFWGSLGPFTLVAPPVAGIFDPRVLYDPHAGRWIFAALVNGSLNINLIGVSKTSDPTGDWNLYRFDLPFSDPLSDHPSMGFNKHWIVYQQNMFGSGVGFVHSDVMVFNKTNLYAGGAGSYTYFTNAVNSQSQVPATTYDDSLSTMYLLGEVGSGGSSLDSVRIYTITGPLGAEVFAVGPTVSISNRWDSGGNSNLGPQLGTAIRINIHAGRISALVYRNGSLWATHHIRHGNPYRSAIQWWQLTPEGQILQRGLIDDPSGVNWYGYPSIAVNRNDDVLIGYSRFSTNQYASANYSFRAATDSPNMLRADMVVKAGEAPFTRIADNALIRWGDYSATRVDPVNDTDLWTIQEYAARPAGGTDRWGTWWAHLIPSLSISINDAVAVEGDSGTTNAVFTVSLSMATNVPVSVDYATADVSALAGADYVATNGTLTFHPGETDKTFTVLINGDLLAEINKVFAVNLTNPTNAAKGRSQGFGTIIDDENVPLSITDVIVSESSIGPTNAVVAVHLLVASKLIVSVDFSTADGTALAGLDYIATNGTLTFNPGETHKTITLAILDDPNDETNESFSVTLSNPVNIIPADTQATATIVDNDAPPSITINDVTVREGDVGFANAIFTLSLSAGSGLPVSVRLITANGGAILRVDYVPTNIVLTFPPGTPTQTTRIMIIGDTLLESNETFFVNLSSPINATLVDARGVCTILDDDLRVTAAEILGSDVRLSFTTQASQTYRCERTGSLTEPVVWAPVPGATTVPGTGAIVQVLDTAGAGGMQRFYRVKLN